MSPVRSVADSRRGFTLMEIMISVCLLAIISVSITHTFLTLNRSSARSRISTAALVVAQHEIDRVMSARPYSSGTTIPPILQPGFPLPAVPNTVGVVGTKAEIAANATTVVRPVDLFVSPENGSVVVQGMLVRKITIINPPNPPNPTIPTLRQVDVVVGFNFTRGTNLATYAYTNQAQFETDYRYQVRLSTFRSPDE